MQDRCPLALQSNATNFTNKLKKIALIYLDLFNENGTSI